MSRYHLSRSAVITRTLLASAGGYLVSLCFVVGCTALLSRGLSMARGEAFMVSTMLAFLVWMLAVLVAYAAVTTKKALAWILGSAALLAAIGWALAPLSAPVGA